MPPALEQAVRAAVKTATRHPCSRLLEVAGHIANHDRVALSAIPGVGAAAASRWVQFLEDLGAVRVERVNGARFRITPNDAVLAIVVGEAHRLRNGGWCER